MKNEKCSDMKFIDFWSYFHVFVRREIPLILLCISLLRNVSLSITPSKTEFEFTLKHNRLFHGLCYDHIRYKHDVYSVATITVTLSCTDRPKILTCFKQLWFRSIVLRALLTDSNSVEAWMRTDSLSHKT